MTSKEEWKSVPCSDLRFLVVEDHAFQRNVLVRLLQAMGAQQIQTAEDGRAALEVINDPARPVDIVISDLSMPGMDGMEFVRHLSELGAPVSLIVASALDENLLAAVREMARGYQVRILGVIGKPPTAAKLTPLIELHRAGQASADAQAAGIPADEIATSWTNHDFDPWYLPELASAGGELRSLTATPRWRHPERGILAPEAFMPSIRARGLLDEFTWTLLEQASRRCAQWRARGLAAKVGLPLLFESYGEVSGAHRITAVVTAAGLAPADAVLIVPPGPMQTQAARVLENLVRLRMEGFALALEYPGGSMEAIDPVTLRAFTHLRIPAALAHDARVAGAVQAGLELMPEGPGPALEGDGILEWERNRRAAARRAMDARA